MLLRSISFYLLSFTVSQEMIIELLHPEIKINRPRNILFRAQLSLDNDFVNLSSEPSYTYISKQSDSPNFFLRYAYIKDLVQNLLIPKSIYE